MRVLVTGAAGFIGFHLCGRLLARGDEVLGIDNLNDYYDVSLKQARLERLGGKRGFGFEKIDIADRAAMQALFSGRFDAVVHLAAQAGVRYSLVNPLAYSDSNLVGFSHVLEGCRRAKPGHLVFASSSSVYGADHRAPFSEHDPADHPVSFYAATKRANELMAHSYSHLYTMPATGLRFFTVYGPWGRPDMALGRFVEAMLADRPIDLFNAGVMKRDFTYIDDLVEALVRLMAAAPERGRPIGPLDSLSQVAPWRVVNIGHGAPVDLMDFVAAIERALGRKARLNLMPMQPGDSPITFADADLLHALTGYRPDTPVEAGVAAYCAWYASYHGLG
jgi:UDP-glucuronate 4-epimerase